MIGKLIKGRGAAGLCAYLLGPTDNSGEVRPRAQVIGGSFAGRDAQELAHEFGQLHDLRPSLGVHVAHLSLRVPEDERQIGDEEWCEIANEWAAGMGFDGYVVVSHGDHIHIGASRVRLDGTVVPDSHDWARSEALIREAERTHGLREIASSHLLEPERATTHRKALTMSQIGMAERGIEPAGQVVARLIETTLASGATTASAFAETLERAGVIVLPNLAPGTGRLSGFAYEYDGVRVTATTMGRGFTLGNLTKRGLSYEPSRDREPLDHLRSRQASGRLGGTSEAAPFHGGGSLAGDSRAHGTEVADDRRDGAGAHADRGGDGAAHGGDAADADAHRVPEPEGARPGSRVGESERGHGEHRDHRDPNGDASERGDPGTAGSGGERRTEPPGAEHLGSGPRGGPDTDSGGVAAGVEDRVPVVLTPAVARLQALAGLVPSGDRTLDQVRAQLGAFGCDAYEVQPIPPEGVEGLRRERIRRWTVDQIEKGLGWLKRMNVLGYDIYIRPAPPTDRAAQPFVFVDDLDRAVVDRMAADGFPFAVLNESSTGRFHGWVRIGETPLDRIEVSRAGRMLAQTYGGDPASTDWRHYGRLAGTTNRKPSRKTLRGPPFVMLRASGGEMAPRAAELMTQVRLSLAEDARRAAEAAKQESARFYPPANADDPYGAFREARRAANPQKMDDESARDFSAALSMLRRGFDPADVKLAMLDGSPRLAERHHNPAGYVERTVEKANGEVTSTPRHRP